MEICTLEDILQHEKLQKRRVNMAVAGAADKGVLKAVIRAHKEGIINGILFGDQEAVKEELTELYEDPGLYQIVHSESDKEAAFQAVQAVREGKAQMIMKGMMNTATLMKEIVNKETGINSGGVISLLMLMEIPGYPKLLGITDVGIIPMPTLEQKKGIIENALGVFERLGYKNPKVAALSYVENVNPKVPETVEGRELEQMNKKGIIRHCIVEGPVSLDIAINSKRAEIKRYPGEIQGDADILLMPNISVGNILVKALGEFVHGINSVAFAVTPKCPVVLTSRATDTEGKYRSILGAAAACRS